MGQKLEVNCRYKRELTEEEKESNEVHRLVHGEDAELTGDKYTYARLVLDLNDVKIFNEVDKDHTCVRLYEGDVAVLKIPYFKFKGIYTNLLGISVTPESQFQVVEG